MNKFESGKTYATRFICDADSRLEITVASRTAKTIKTACGKTLRIGEYDGVEFVRPLGNYSMAPIVRAA
jgi:hypothetical protein